MSNQEIASLLRSVAASYTIKNESKYRFQIIAYQKAADAVEGSADQLKDLYTEKKLDTIPGVGPSIKQHLEELFKTGKVKHFEFVRKGIPETVFALMQVPTFGPKKAYKLSMEFHLKNPKTVFSDVEKLAKKDKIAKLEGFGEKSQSDILQALEEFKLGFGKTTRMVLPFAFDLAEKLVEYMKKEKEVKQIQPLGSLRRMKETVGDIDLAVSTDNPKVVIDYFVAYPYKERIIEQGTATASILASGGKQIDLMTVPIDSYGALLQHFTGSKNHNIALREYAQSKGWSLSERGIKKKSKKGEIMEKFTTEEAFYKELDMQWIPPEMREDTGEIELALRSKLPKIIELQDIKGDIHIHSSFSIEPSHDMGKDSMEDMLEKGKALEYEYLGFSEHNPSVSKHTKEQIYSLLARKKEKIEQLNKSKKYIRAINLLETDILSNGRLPLDDKALRYLDAIIVSIHSSFGMNKKDMTKRILGGLSHPKAKLLCHPTGRMLNQRPGYEIDFEQILDFCKKHNKALEINAWPNRLDLSDIYIRQAVEAGVKMIINTDSHELWQMDMMKFGVAMARRGWAKGLDILNTLSYNQFASWISQP